MIPDELATPIQELSYDDAVERISGGNEKVKDFMHEIFMHFMYSCEQQIGRHEEKVAAAQEETKKVIQYLEAMDISGTDVLRARAAAKDNNVGAFIEQIADMKSTDLDVMDVSRRFIDRVNDTEKTSDDYWSEKGRDTKRYYFPLEFGHTGKLPEKLEGNAAIPTEDVQLPEIETGNLKLRNAR